MPLPTFLIVGAQKSGTSSLARYLERHEDIWVHKNELHFFSLEERYRRGLEWYESLFEDAQDATIIGEKSPPYSADPVPIERIHVDLPNAKIIWIFRNPVKRAYSNYFHRIREGSEVLPFDEAIRRNLEQMEKGEDINHSYVGLSQFAKQVKWYLKYWDLNDMHFMLLEEFQKDTETQLRKVFDFLGAAQPDSISIPNKRFNKFYRPRSLNLQSKIYKSTGGQFGKHPKLYRYLSLMNRSLVREYPPMSNEVNKLLKDVFTEDILELSALTGLDLSVWK